ncbi:hypothetical protein EV424DRAFT_1352385 [Suillus variegatus]|nr:hypothetical protein EV424DRAFT_1352385 [Suillus variegatus]
MRFGSWIATLMHTIQETAQAMKTKSDRDAAIDNPLDAALREKSVEILEKIRIFTEPALTFLSQSYDCVMELLNDDNLDLVTLEKNWNAVKTLRVHDIRDAVDDVLRANKEDDYVMVLEPRWGAKELILAGFIPNNIPLSSPWHSIICTDSDSQLFGSMWKETKRNLFLYGSLSLDDAKAQAFVNGCIQHPELSLGERGYQGNHVRND